MNTETFALLCAAAKRMKNENGDPLCVTTFIRTEAIAEARRLLAEQNCLNARAINVRVRLRDSEKQILTRAANLKGMGFSRFMGNVAERRAESLVTNARPIVRSAV